jgi:hypothetical protein
MPADGVQVIDVVMDAPCQLGAVTDGLRLAAIAQVEEDDRPSIGETLEALEHMNRVGYDDWVGAAPQLLEEQPNSIARGDVTLAW